MSYELTSDLMIAAATIFVLGMVICLRVLSVPASMAVAGIKTALPFVYFIFFYDGSWTFLDDMGYLEQGQKLLASGYDPWTFLFSGEAVSRLVALSGGHHILYGWYNLLAQWIFGEYYFSPVFLNVGLTFVSAYFLYRLAIATGFSTPYARGLFVFFSLHWELLAWSSLVNLKDTLVLLMTIALMYTTLRFVQTRWARYAVGTMALFFAFFWIRFYIPLLLLLATFLTLLCHLRERRHIWAAIFVASFFGLAYGAYVGWEYLIFQIEQLDFGGKIIFGLSRMVLTPLPWSIEPEYTFLQLPAVFHWLFFVPAILGGAMLWRVRPEIRPLFVYLVIALLLYGAYEELQGPRHRVQLIFIYAWAQFHFIWDVLRKSMSQNKIMQVPA